MKRWNIIYGLALALLIGLAAQPVRAQRGHGGGAASHAPSMRAAGPRPAGSGHADAHAAQRPAMRPGYAARAPQAPNNAAHLGGGANSAANADREGGLKRLSPGVRQNLRDMSPQEQDRFLQNSERFRSLPPQQQAQIRNNLRKWNNLSSTERNAMNDRARAWERMSPQKRQYIQNDLLPKWQRMSPDRKQLVTGRLHTLQGMTPEERQSALQDPQFMRGLSPDEQSVLRGLDSMSPSRP